MARRRQTGLCSLSGAGTCELEPLHMGTKPLAVSVGQVDGGRRLGQGASSPTLPRSGRSSEEFKSLNLRGSWVAQSVKCSTSAQVKISPFVGLSPKSVSVLTSWRLEPSSDSVSPSLSLSLPHSLSLSLSLSKISVTKKIRRFHFLFAKLY